MRYNSFLKLPKKEVPDTTNSSTTTSNEEQKFLDDVMDELEGILGIEDEENLSKHDNSSDVYGQVSWNFIDWVGGPSGRDMEGGEIDYNNIDDRSNFFEENINHQDYFDGCSVIKSESSTGGFWECGDDEKRVPLNLNLNYQEVLDAWSDRGTLWAEDASLHMSATNGYYMGEVPVMEEERTRREASVLRYKEKRQTRLFSKKIRYQVRKLNADNRPRLKGRFVKRI